MTIMLRALGMGAVLMATGALARPMTADDIAKLERVTALAVSPDGSRVAFGVSGLPDLAAGEEDGPEERSLGMAFGPQNARAFLPEEMDVSDIGFSPDGRLATFLWTDDGGGENEDAHQALYAIPVDGGGHYKLAELEDADVNAYAFAPDGGSVFLLAGAAPDEGREEEEEAGFDAVVFEEEFEFNRLFRADVRGRALDEEPAQLEVPGQVSAMEVSPDGRLLAVASAPTPLVDASYTSKRVQLIDAETGRLVRVIETPGKIGDFEFSPDGRMLSLIAAVDANDPAATTLHLVDVDTGALRALNAGAPEAAVDAEWLDDPASTSGAGDRLAAVIHVGTASRYRVYNADGSVAGEIDPGSLILTDIETDGGRVAALANAPSHPGELFVLSGERFERWTSHNPWLAEIDFGPQRVFAFTARDGQRIEGVLVEPVGGIPAGGAPTIFAVHGGPEAHDSNGWLTSYSDPGQAGAGAGYAVFYPNYRGSTAYGTAFSKQHQGDYAGKEFNDLVDAIGALAQEGVTDRDRVGITGGSYGGYATAWGATALSEHFAAGVMFVGISNQISKFGTTDIPEEMHLVHSRAWPWEDWQGMLEVSPIYHVDKAETPLLILHGDADTRVHPAQSLELYRHMKLRTDTPVRLVLYPDEPHGNRMAAARYDYSKRMMRWFDRYLLGEGEGLPRPRVDLPEGMIEAAGQ